MRRFWPMTAIGLVLAVGLGYALSCSSPTRPKEPKDLRLYVTEGWTNNIYVFNPESKTLLDSIYADYPLAWCYRPMVSTFLLLTMPHRPRADKS